MNKSILESLTSDCASPLVLPLNTLSWLIIRQVSDFIFHLHNRAWRQPGISAGPKSPFLNPFHGQAKYQLYRQWSSSPGKQRNMTFWIFISRFCFPTFLLSRQSKQTHESILVRPHCLPLQIVALNAQSTLCTCPTSYNQQYTLVTFISNQWVSLDYPSLSPQWPLCKVITIYFRAGTSKSLQSITMHTEHKSQAGMFN